MCVAPDPHSHHGTYPSGVICEDPRQFVPATGQAWTSLSDLLSSRKHSFQRDEEDERISFIHTEPAFGINQTRMRLASSVPEAQLTTSDPDRDGRRILCLGLRSVHISPPARPSERAQDPAQSNSHLAPSRPCQTQQWAPLTAVLRYILDVVESTQSASVFV